jgi:hypothetical protein
MAKKAAAGPNKSKAIRDYKSKNDGAGPKEIAEALGKDGVKVTPAFVSTVLSNDRRKAGKPGRRRRRGGRRAVGRPAGGMGGSSFDRLVQAKRLADQMGGVDKARAALDALARILG